MTATSPPSRSHRKRRQNEHTKLSLVLSEIAPQLAIGGVSPDSVSRISKYAHDLTRLKKKQISSKHELFKILEENNSSNPEDEINDWMNRHVIMNALTDENAVSNKQICFSGLPVQFLFASNYLKETYETNKDSQFFFPVIDEGRYYPGNEILNFLMELLEEKDVEVLIGCFLTLLAENPKNYDVALAATIVLNCDDPNKEGFKQLAQRLDELKVVPYLERNEKMIDPTSLPILMKILDFLFGEGSKILEERRERRKTQGDSVEIIVPEYNTKESNNAITTKDVALGEKIDKAAWFSVERSIQNKFSLLETYAKNYYLAKEKYAKWTSALVPPIVLHELEEAESNLINTISDLQEILGNVYGKQFKLPYL